MAWLSPPSPLNFLFSPSHKPNPGTKLRQDFALTRQVLYHRAIIPALFLVFVLRQGLLSLGWLWTHCSPGRPWTLHTPILILPVPETTALHRETWFHYIFLDRAETPLQGRVLGRRVPREPSALYASLGEQSHPTPLMLLAPRLNDKWLTFKTFLKGEVPPPKIQLYF